MKSILVLVNILKLDIMFKKNGRVKNIFMEMRFLDSLRFLSSSLEKLVINVPVENLKVL